MDWIRKELQQVFSLPLDELLNAAWQVRQQLHRPLLSFAAPGLKNYEIDAYRNSQNDFIAMSITGDACTLQCEHCKAKLLTSMLPVHDARQMIDLGKKYSALGCQGVLVSGGAEATGEVPLKDFAYGLKGLKDLGLKVIVHAGLVTKETAEVLKQCHVDQVLLDIIGDGKTAEQVYHLQKGPEDYGNTLMMLEEMGLETAPHIVIGLHYGKIVGELEALFQIARAKPKVIVFVVLNPLAGTTMTEVRGPDPEEVAKIIALARIINKNAKVSLGCAKPAGLKKKRIEEYALRAGINTIAFPAMETVTLAKGLGLEVCFSSLCCSLI